MNTFRSQLLGSATLLLLVLILSVTWTHRAHSAGGAVAVQVSNTPLPTSDLALSGAQAYQTFVTIPIADNLNYNSGSLTVPTGKRFIVEDVTVYRVPTSSNTLTAGQDLQVQLNPDLNGVYTYYYMPLIPATAGFNLSGASAPLHFYADTTGTLRLFVTRSGYSGAENDVVDVSGYLI